MLGQSPKHFDVPDRVMSLTTYIDSAWNSLLESITEDATAESLVSDADAARDRQEWSLAAKLYAEAIALGYGGGGVKVQLGHALKEMGNFDGAEELYRRFLRDNPDDADIHLQLGHLFNKKGDIETAATFYEQAYGLAPQDSEISRHVGMARSNVGRGDLVRRRNAAMDAVANRQWDDARTLLRTLVAVDGEKDLIGVFANVTKESGRLDEAAALYDCYLSYATTSSQPDLIADCHVQLGHLHKIQGQYSEALSHFNRARKLERESGEIEQEELEVEREIVGCLREIYPCFVFKN